MKSFPKFPPRQSSLKHLEIQKWCRFNCSTAVPFSWREKRVRSVRGWGWRNGFRIKTVHLQLHWPDGFDTDRSCVIRVASENAQCTLWGDLVKMRSAFEGGLHLRKFHCLEWCRARFCQRLLTAEFLKNGKWRDNKGWMSTSLSHAMTCSSQPLVKLVFYAFQTSLVPPHLPLKHETIGRLTWARMHATATSSPTGCHRWYAVVCEFKYAIEGRSEWRFDFGHNSWKFSRNLLEFLCLSVDRCTLVNIFLFLWH